MYDLLNSGYYGTGVLRSMGFGSVGENVQVAKSCTIVNCKNIYIGSNVRIDGYTTIVASEQEDIVIGSYIHIGSHCIILGGAGLRMEDFSGVSHGVHLYTKSDDYSGKFMTNPMVPEIYRAVKQGPIRLGRHVIVGASCVVLPDVNIEEGSAVGALSMVTKNLSAWGIYLGVPAKKIKNRSKNILEIEIQFKQAKLT